MKYKLLLLDIDGTLRPGSCEQIPRENAAAVRAVQKAGVKIANATGRGRTGVGKGLLRDLKPDYWVCAGGAQLVDAKGSDLALHRLTPEEMYALVDFFEDYELPLRFTFHDANYAYLDFAEFDRREKAKNLEQTIEPRLLAAFKRIRKNSRNGLGIVYVQRDACGGCFNKIPPQRQLDIRMRKKIIVCEYCGRIMIDPELAGVKIEKPADEKPKRRSRRTATK